MWDLNYKHLHILFTMQIDHFRITFGLFFKASLGAHPFIWKLVFIHMQMKTNFHMKRWAPGLALKKRPKVIRKWPIALFRVIWAVFAFLLFLDAFPFDLTLSITSISPQFDGVRLQLENFPRIQWAIFVASRSRSGNPVFHWSAAWPSWQPLWWGEKSS